MSEERPGAPFRRAQPIEAERVCNDILATAALVGAPAEPKVIRGFVDAFHPFVTTSALSFRATTRTEAEVNFRYVELEIPHDPLAIAHAAGLMPSELSSPMARFLPEIQQNLPILGYGVDAGAATGIEKIWPFFPHRPIPTGQVCEMASLPRAVREHAELMARFDLDVVSLFAVDYRHQTVNLYFMKAPGSYAPERIAQMIAASGFDVPSADIVGLCARSIPIYLTFHWDSHKIERLCFSTVFDSPADVPTHLHPTIEQFVAGVPFATQEQQFIFNVAFNRDGSYFKIENDYNGAMIQLMKQF